MAPELEDMLTWLKATEKVPPYGARDENNALERALDQYKRAIENWLGQGTSKQKFDEDVGISSARNQVFEAGTLEFTLAAAVVASESAKMATTAERRITVQLSDETLNLHAGHYAITAVDHHRTAVHAKNVLLVAAVLALSLIFAASQITISDPMKIAAAVVVGLILAILASDYRAQKHGEITNKAKENLIKSLLLVLAMPGIEKQKEQLLLEIMKSLAQSPTTGYVGKEATVVAAQEVLKTVREMKS